MSPQSVRIEHIAEMFSLKGGGDCGDLGPRSASTVTILRDTTHGALMSRGQAIIPMISDFLDSKSAKH